MECCAFGGALDSESCLLHRIIRKSSSSLKVCKYRKLHLGEQFVFNMFVFWSSCVSTHPRPDPAAGYVLGRWVTGPSASPCSATTWPLCLVEGWVNGAAAPPPWGPWVLTGAPEPGGDWAMALWALGERQCFHIHLPVTKPHSLWMGQVGCIVSQPNGSHVLQVGVWALVLSASTCAGFCTPGRMQAEGGWDFLTMRHFLWGNRKVHRKEVKSSGPGLLMQNQGEIVKILEMENGNKLNHILVLHGSVKLLQNTRLSQLRWLQWDACSWVGMNSSGGRGAEQIFMNWSTSSDNWNAWKSSQHW